MRIDREDVPLDFALDRLMDRVHKCPDEGSKDFDPARSAYGLGCWEWEGALHNDGYGFITVLGHQFYTHRLAYEASVGPIPTYLQPSTDPSKPPRLVSMFLLHACDNRKCCRPEHLTPGTSAENQMDMVMKARSGSQKATEEVVRYMRGFFDSERAVGVPAERLLDALTESSGLSRSSVANIVYRRTWKWVR